MGKYWWHSFFRIMTLQLQVINNDITNELTLAIYYSTMIVIDT